MDTSSCRNNEAAPADNGAKTTTKEDLQSTSGGGGSSIPAVSSSDDISNPPPPDTEALIDDVIHSQFDYDDDQCTLHDGTADAEHHCSDKVPLTSCTDDHKMIVDIDSGVASDSATPKTATDTTTDDVTTMIDPAAAAKVQDDNRLETSKNVESNPPLETQQMKDRLLQVGDKVYSPYPGINPDSEQYYWGRIGKKYKDGIVWKYDIDFFDGDHAAGLASSALHRMKETLTYMRQGHFNWDAPPKEYVEEKVPIKSYRELYDQRCQCCDQCWRKACGKCIACVQNKMSGASRSTMQCCVQTVCSCFGIAEKAQTCATLPDGWRYFFEDPASNPHYHGLFLVPASNLDDAEKKTHRVRSFKNAKNRFPVLFAECDAAKFYDEVGLPQDLDEQSPTLPMLDSKEDSLASTIKKPASRLRARSAKNYAHETISPLSLRELYERRCQSCAQCKREDCGKCFSCMQNVASGTESTQHQCCVQKMCSTISLHDKARRCEGFLPDNWLYLFEDVSENPRYGGLVIVSVSNMTNPSKSLMKVRSFENVANRCGNSFRGLDAKKFYDNLGITMPSPQQQPTVVRKRRTSTETTRTTSTYKPVIPNRPPPKTLQELYEGRCQSCPQCMREECNKCFACKQNQSSTTESSSRVCCVQKMCSKFSFEDKAQNCKGFLPDAWLYLFEDKNGNPKYDGLIIVSVANLVNPLKATLKMKSFEGVANRCGNSFDAFDSEKFYNHLGITPPPPTASIATKPARPRVCVTPKKFTSDSWTLRELLEKRCENCENCSRPVCSKCDSCVQAKGDVCLRRVCYKISPENKSQSAPYFPQGWCFYFSREETKGKCLPAGLIERLDGLVLIAPNGRRYFCVETAVNAHKTLLERDPSPLQFYAFAGIEMTESESKELVTPYRKRRAEESAQIIREDYSWGKRPRAAKNGIPVEVAMAKGESFQSSVPALMPQAPPLTPTELYKRRCKKCKMCLRENCGQCATCILNKSRTRKEKEVCLRKICLTIPEQQKRQPACGFPNGWTFAFEYVEEEIDPAIHPDIVGLRIISGAGVRYKTVDAAMNRHVKQLEDLEFMKHVFYQQIGAKMLELDKNNPLIQQGYVQEWINVDGMKQVMYGTITKVEMDKSENRKKFTIVYDKRNRDLVNSLPTSCGCVRAPETTVVDEKMAWGGHLLFQQNTGREKKFETSEEVPFHIKWRTPDYYRCEMVHSHRTDGSAASVPRVSILYKGFELTFSARKSTIPNAGYGVFLSCKPILAPSANERPTHFELAAGELLDFGIYAPFRTEDKRDDHAFLLKNFIHNFACEEYSFETTDAHTIDGNEFVFDITDDNTGKLHFEARRHITPYVNEISRPNQIPCVNARFDCQGALHYLLGHPEKHDGAFRISADGREKEIFVDYGENYEKCRLRGGFPRWPMSPAERDKALKNEETEYLEEIRTYTANEVKRNIKLLSKMVGLRRDLEQPVIERTVVVGILLRQRIKAIIDDFADLGEDDSFCDNGATDNDLHGMMKDCGKLLKHLCELWGNDRDMQARLLTVDIFMRSCTEVFKGMELETMSPAEFRNLLCGNMEYLFEV